MNTRIALALSLSALFVLVGCGKRAEYHVPKDYRESTRLSPPKATAVGASPNCVMYELVREGGLPTLYFTESPTGFAFCGGVTIK